MPEKRHKRDVEGSIGNARIRSKDSKYASQRGSNEQGLSPQAKSEPRTVRCHVQPEDAQEKVAERVKHFGEEVPP